MNQMQIFKTNSNNLSNDGGSSSSFFFFTEDRKFIIKTMSLLEKKTLMKALPEMVKFMVTTGGKSLISRVYGVYMVEYPGISPVYLMLQKNNIQIDPVNTILSVFDLKGSKMNRQIISNKKLYGQKDKNGNRRRIMDREIMQDKEFQKAMRMSVFSINTQDRQQSMHSEESAEVRFAESILFQRGKSKQNSMKAIPAKNNQLLNDTPPEEKELKDIYLKELSSSTLKDVDFENLVMGELLTIDINENDVALILKTLGRDIEFL